MIGPEHPLDIRPYAGVSTCWPTALLLVGEEVVGALYMEREPHTVGRLDDRGVKMAETSQHPEWNVWLRGRQMADPDDPRGEPVDLLHGFPDCPVHLAGAEALDVARLHGAVRGDSFQASFADLPEWLRHPHDDGATAATDVFKEEL